MAKRYSGERILPLWADADAQLEKNRFAKINTTTLKASYTDYGDFADGVVRQRSNDDDYDTTVMPLDFVDTTFFVEMASSVSKGDFVFPSADGKGVAKSHDVVSMSVMSEPDPAEACKYVVPASEWGGENGGALAEFDGTEFTYTPASELAGVVVYDESRSKYFICDGEDWLETKKAAIAGADGVSGSHIVCYELKKASAISIEDVPLNLLANGNIVVAGKTASANDTSGTITVEDARILAGDLIFATVITADASVYVRKAVATENTATITLSGAGGTGTSVGYIIIRTR